MLYVALISNVILFVIVVKLYKRIQSLQKQVLVLERFNGQQITLNNHMVKAIQKQHETERSERVVIPYIGMIGQA